MLQEKKETTLGTGVNTTAGNVLKGTRLIKTVVTERRITPPSRAGKRRIMASKKVLEKALELAATFTRPVGGVSQQAGGRWEL